MFPRTTGRNWPRNTIEELIKQEFRAMIKSGEIPTGGGAPAMGSVWDSMITFRHGARVIQRDPVTRIDSRMRLSMFNKNTYYDAGGLWHLGGIEPAGYQKYNEGLIYGHHPGFDDLYYGSGVPYVGGELDFDTRYGFRFFGLKAGSNYTFPWSTPKVWIFSEESSAGTSGYAAQYPVTVWIDKTSNRLIVYDDVPPVHIAVCEYSLTEDITAAYPISGATVSIANPTCYYAFMAYDEGTDTNYLENTLFTSTLINGCIMLSIPNDQGAYLYNITDDEILKLVYPGQDNITVQHVSLGYGV